MREKPEPGKLYVVGETMPKPMDITETLSGALPECLARIEAMEYAGAFSHFAEKLELAERELKESFFSEAVQKPIRQNLKQIWNSFLKDIKDPKKKIDRLNALRDQIEASLAAHHAKSRDSQTQPDELSNDNKKYYGALAAQRAENNTVVPFANEASKSEHFKREMGHLIDRRFSAPIDAIYAPELRHMASIGELFNKVLPMLRQVMEGYVEPLIEGKRMYSNYVPVTADIVQANIVAYLEQAPALVKTFVELSEQRDNVQKSTRKNSPNK